VYTAFVGLPGSVDNRIFLPVVVTDFLNNVDASFDFVSINVELKVLGLILI
jgi:hypothetical protein